MEQNDYNLVEPYNPTDPVVKIDPELDKNHIVLPYTNTETIGETSPYDAPYGNHTVLLLCRCCR